jgi:hypothetical protein
MSASTIDFLRPRRSSMLGWVLLALGTVALGTVLQVDRQWKRERVQQETAAAARTAETERRRRDAERPVSLSPDQRRLARVSPQLRQPWLPVLRLLEGTTRPPVYLVALAIDPAAGAVRVEGEAPSFEKALEYAQALDQEGLLGPAELRSHEQMIDPTGQPAVRFTIVTRWSSR